MYVCEYCGRHLKKKYDKCPACGSTLFKKIQNVGEEIIKEPPKDGYKINLINYKYEKVGYRPIAIVGAIILMNGLFFCMKFIKIGMSNDGTSPDWFGYTFLIVGVFFFFIILKKVLELFKKSNQVLQTSNKDIDKVEYLAKHGMLIKNLKYKIKPMKGMKNANKKIYKIQVIYEIEKGKTKCFESEPKYLTTLGRDDGTVDLLIDPNDYSNYFIDFDIY